MKEITIGTKVRSTKTGIEVTIKNISVDMSLEVGNVWVSFDINGKEKVMELKRMVENVKCGDLEIK